MDVITKMMMGEWFLLLLAIIKTCHGLDTSSCRTALGMQSGVLPDDFITASSAYDISVSAPNARIRVERNGGAWCPKGQVTREGDQYLQIDLGELTVITMVETQGRFGNGQGQEYAEEYEIHYQREDDGPWFKFRDRQGKHIFTGNTNTYIAELRELNPALITRRIRFVPLSDHPKTVCMRVEVYGCPWKDGLVSYSMRQGEQRGNEISLRDETYDGDKSDMHLTGGLGQLTDGVEGQSNFRLDPLGIDVKGYDWIGWRNDSVGGKPIDIILKFDAVRNFTSMRIHCNNLMKKDVYVFKKAEIFFSVGGKYFVTDPIEFNYMRDELIEYARPVIIPLKNSIGRYIKLVLHFDSRWILISELQISSEYAVGNFTEEMPPTTTPPPPTSTSGLLKEILVRSYGNNSQVGSPDGHVGNQMTTSSNVEVYGTQGRRHNDDEIIGIVIGILATLILLLFILMVIIIIRQKRAKFLSSHRAAKVVEPNTNGAVNMATITPTAPGTLASTSNGKHVSNGKVYSYVAGSDIESDREGTWAKIAHYREPHDSIQHRKLPELPRTPESTDTNTSREYAIPDMTKSSVIVNIPPPPPPPPRRPHNIYGVNPSMPLDSGVPYYSVAEAVNIQGTSGSNTYAVANAEALFKEDFSVMEFPRENLKFIENLGEGQFGEVHLAEASNVTEFLGDDFLVSRTGTSRSMKVVVKMLKKNIADDTRYASCRYDFHREVRIMCRLNHSNVVRVLGVCSKEDPLCVIVEYMKYGDLNQYLKQHVPEGTVARRNKAPKTLSNGCLTYMASQVASGMKYLETLNVVHRDLAARNCLVGHLYTIKISDFGMSRNLYSADYYRIEGKAVLPIRWMAWESVLLGKFSSKSDVWSFGVTLWEILTFAREQPYEELTDEQVIENCTHYFHSDNQQVYLPQPGACPKEIYDLMRECWNREENDRPAFKEIHMFLQRKSMGYDPKTECRSTLQRERISIPVV